MSPTLINQSYIIILNKEWKDNNIYYSFIVKKIWRGWTCEINVCVNCIWRWQTQEQDIRFEHPWQKQFTSLIVLKWHVCSLNNRRWYFYDFLRWEIYERISLWIFWTADYTIVESSTQQTLDFKTRFIEYVYRILFYCVLVIGRLSLNAFFQTQCIFIVPLFQINTLQLSYFF